jgi:integrase
MESYTDPQTGHTTKRRRTALNATSINKTLATLSAILQDAADYELIPRNPAQGRRRRLPSVTLTRTVIDRADHLEALLAAAASLDGDARCRHGQRRALISTLAFGGLRLGECLALTWRDIDLGRGVIRVRQGKTDAAARDVPILGVLRDELDTYSARVRGEPHQLVFGSSTGRQQSPSNIRRRILTPAVERANKALKKAGVVEPIPNVTPHSLRRTAASIWFAIGWAPPAVMAAMGHTTAGLTLSIYARQMNRQDGEPERLKTLIQGGVLAEEKAETPEPTEDKEGLPSNA